MIILASASPRRRELLARIGFELAVRPSDVDEREHPGEAPGAYVDRIALAKARVCARAAGEWVIAADTTVTIDGRILAKAADGAEATAMLRALRGRVHEVMTAFVVLGDRGEHVERVTTEVAMVDYDDAAIADYVASDEWRGKAGAYALQGIAAALVREVRGSVTNVIGLPLAEVCAALVALGGPRARLAAGSAA